MTSGIYQITCLVNGKRYIGSSVDVARRWGIHKSQLRHKKHPNPKLQAAWNKYGEAQFIFEVVEPVESEKLAAAELAWLTTEKPELNINPRPDAPMRGVRMTDEHKAKIGAALKGRAVSDETRALIARKNRGNKSAFGIRRSEEFKARLRARMTPELIGKLHSNTSARNEKIRAWWTEERRAAQAHRIRARQCRTST